MNRQKLYYLNPGIKKINVIQNYSQEDLSEYLKCSEDPIYFVEKYCKIQHVDFGLIDFQLRGYQKNLLETYHKERNVIVLAPRQSGKTITTVGYLLWFVLFNSEKTVAILANKGPVARSILGRVMKAYENIPFFLQPGCKILNKGLIELGNGSVIIAEATTSDGIRSYSCSIVYIDEFSFVKNAESFFTGTFPVISSGEKTKLIVSSTPSGLNLFYKFWKDAKENKNNMHPFEIKCQDVPGRDENWINEQIKILGEYRFRQEYGNEFLGSSNTLIAGWKLQELVYENPIRYDKFYKILEEPQENNIYVAVVDSSRGVNHDYSTITIINVTKSPFKIVATYRNNEISTLLFPEVVVDFSKKYNNAILIIERNNMGESVANVCAFQLSYENMIFSKTRGRLGQIVSLNNQSGYSPGVEMTKSVKRIGCSILKTLIENNNIINFTDDIVLELYNFIGVGDSYTADEGKHDDLVMNLIMFSWFADSELFKQYTNHSIRKTTVEEIEKPYYFVSSVESYSTEDYEEDIRLLFGDRFNSINRNLNFDK